MASTIKNQVICQVYPGGDEATLYLGCRTVSEIQSRSHEKYLPLICFLDLVVEINSVVKLLATATSPDTQETLPENEKNYRIR